MTLRSHQTIPYGKVKSLIVWRTPPSWRKDRFQRSKLQDTVMAPQVQLIDKYVKVPEIMQRQVPMNQKARKDQTPEEAQISLEMYVGRMEDCHNDKLGTARRQCRSKAIDVFGSVAQTKMHTCNNHNITDSSYSKDTRNQRASSLNNFRKGGKTQNTTAHSQMR